MMNGRNVLSTLSTENSTAPTYDAWDYYNALLCPTVTRDKQETSTRDISSEIFQFSKNLQLIFEKFNLTRSQRFVQIFSDVVGLEKKVKRVEEKMDAITSSVNDRRGSVETGQNSTSLTADDQRSCACAEMRQSVGYLLEMFHAFNLKRDVVYKRMVDGFASLEVKLRSVEQRLERITLSMDQQRNVIRGQRRAINDCARRVQNDQNEIFSRVSCCICLEREKDTAFDCGHMLCGECASKTKTSTGICPICREKITTVTQMYH